MLTIIRNANVFAPEPLGLQDILIAGGRIEQIAPAISLSGIAYEEFDAAGQIVTPGFIDKHVHVTGGGGEFGFASYAEPVRAEELLGVGTTTVVGLLGTDGVLKDLHGLYARVKALDVPMTAYMLTGSYAYPPKTLTGSVDRDIVLIDKVIGCKLAMSDDRGSFPTEHETARLLTQIRRGAMVTGKCGILHIHLGVLDTYIDIIESITRRMPKLLPHVSLTHCARDRELFIRCMDYARTGGNLDITTGGSRFTEPYVAVAIALENEVPLDRITFSTDGHGGIRHIDPATGEETYGTGPVGGNLAEIRNLVDNGVLPLGQALRLVTSTPARELKLMRKGRLVPGCDADLVVFDSALLPLAVFAKGVKVVNNFADMD
ncbi:MAG: beta-aspartyl-peptidase [Bacteroidales bacterium]|nr:beta-aspartyl-peptidase [Bacteroidales bacterium]